MFIETYEWVIINISSIKKIEADKDWAEVYIYLIGEDVPYVWKIHAIIDETRWGHIQKDLKEIKLMLWDNFLERIE